MPAPEVIREQAHITAVRALSNPETEEAERLNLLAHMLHPDVGITDRALTVYEKGNAFPTTEREQILTYAVQALEREVIGTPEGRVDLEIFRERDPLAWAAAFARSCIKSGVTVVRRTRHRNPGRTIDAAGVQLATDSAEDAYLESIKAENVDSILDAVDTWDRRRMSNHEKATSIAKQLRFYYDVPRPFITDPGTARWVTATLKDDTHTAKQQIVFSRDAAAGGYRTCGNIDPRLLDLWADYSTGDLETLQTAPAHVTTAIVEGEASIPDAPGNKHRVNLRKSLRALDHRTGWHTLVTRLENAWVATYFDARTTKDNRDTRDRQQAENDRARQATEWANITAEAIRFGGVYKNDHTPEDINTHLQKLLRQVQDDR